MVAAESVVVQFRDVGRDKKTWKSRVPWTPTGPSLDALERAVIRKRALLSRDVEVTTNGHNEGHIFAGMRVVGTWRVVEGA